MLIVRCGWVGCYVIGCIALWGMGTIEVSIVFCGFGGLGWWGLGWLFKRLK